MLPEMLAAWADELMRALEYGVRWDLKVRSIDIISYRQRLEALKAAAPVEAPA